MNTTNIAVARTMPVLTANNSFSDFLLTTSGTYRDIRFEYSISMMIQRTPD